MRRALLDTNVLLLLLLGGARPDEVGRHKRLRTFTAADLATLLTLSGRFDAFVTLPYIMAETSNLLGIGKSADAEVVAAFRRFAGQAIEVDVTTGALIDDPLMMRLGLTDTAIARMRYDRTEIITVDFQLFGIVQKLGLRATNLRHLADLSSGGANA